MATAENQIQSNLPVQIPTDAEIDQIRKKGAAVVAHNREVNKLTKMIEGLEWGSGTMAVKGSSFSPATRYAFAEFCKVVGANPQMHVDILGGKFFLNSGFWIERINKDDHFVDFEQRNISGDPEARAHYGAPEWATHVYETIIKKLVNFAPIEKIRTGEILDWERYVVEVREANWAGNKPKATTASGKTYDPDPVGNADPAKSARTRSLRRCAVRSFPAWMAAYEEQVRKAEEAVEAEWYEVREPRQVGARGPQALTAGAGEPAATSTDGARQLPVEDHASNESAPDDHLAQTGAPVAQDQTTAAQRDYFSALRSTYGNDGVKSVDRYAWQEANGLPRSVKDFTPANYSAAQQVLAQLKPVIENIAEGAHILGFASIAAMLSEWHVNMPLTQAEANDLFAAVRGKIDADEGR